MGVLCCSSPTARLEDPTKDDYGLPDFEKIKDPFIKFEKDYPLCRLNVRRFFKIVDALGKETFNCKDLSQVCMTKSFLGALKEGTPFNQLLS